MSGDKESGKGADCALGLHSGDVAMYQPQMRYFLTACRSDVAKYLALLAPTGPLTSDHGTPALVGSIETGTRVCSIDTCDGVPH